MADVSVRTARGSDASALADVQVACWLEAYTGVLPPDALAALADGRDDIAGQWRDSAESPPSPRHRVLVACEGPSVVGAAAIGPAADADLDPAADGEVLTLLVAPAHRRSGHGSRLLSATVDHLRAAGFARGAAWLDESDAATRGLFGSAGWGDDGSRRLLDLEDDGTVVVRQVRLHTDLTEEGS